MGKLELVFMNSSAVCGTHILSSLYLKRNSLDAWTKLEKGRNPGRLAGTSLFVTDRCSK